MRFKVIVLNFSELYFLIPVFCLFSFIQSIFGVGLLIFGTPTLLLYGYSYEHALQLLLPSSLVISVVQVIWSREYLHDHKKMILIVVPSLVVGLVLVLQQKNFVEVKKLVGSVLIFIWATRKSNYLRNVLLDLVGSYKYQYISIMGFIHGISNMGGGLLTNLMLSLHQDKNRIRVNIAMIYMVFALSQLLVLVIMGGFEQWPQSLSLIPLSITIYFFFGRHVVYRVNDARYQSIISYIILFFGAVSFF